ERGHWRQGLFCQELAGRKESVCLYPRRFGASLFVQLLSQAESQSRMALHQSTTRRRPLEEVSRPDEERISSQTEPVFYRQCASRVCAELIQQNRANVDIWKQLSSLPFYQAILIPSLATLSQAFHSGPGGH